MDNPEEDKLRKQKFLKEQIMENEQYDVDVFIEFMAGEKENGEDVDNWTFSELREAVHRYQAKEEQLNSKGYIGERGGEGTARKGGRDGWGSLTWRGSFLMCLKGGI